MHDETFVCYQKALVLDAQPKKCEPICYAYDMLTDATQAWRNVAVMADDLLVSAKNLYPKSMGS